MAVKKGFKLTEVGEIPEDWEVNKIKDLCSITTGSKNTEDNIPDGKYPFFVRSQNVEKINSYSFDGEGVLTAGDGVGTGKIFHYINGKCDIHQRVYLLYEFRDFISVKFFFYYFRNYFYDRVMKMTAKSSVDSVRKDMISEMLIAIPPKKEQLKIVSYFSNTDSLISSLEQLIAKKRLVKQGVMQELLTGKKRLPRCDGEWLVIKYGNIGNFLNHANFSHAQLNEEKGDRCLHYSFIHASKSPTLFSNNLPGINHDLVNNYDRLKTGDIIFTDVSEDIEGIGKAITLIVDNNNWVISGLHTIPFRCSQDYVDLSFAPYLPHIPEIKNYLRKFAVGTKVYSITKSILAKVEIKIPPKDEQAAIAAVLSDMDEEIAVLEAKLEKARKIREGMMAELLTGRIRLV